MTKLKIKIGIDSELLKNESFFSPIVDERCADCITHLFESRSRRSPKSSDQTCTHTQTSVNHDPANQIYLYCFPLCVLLHVCSAVDGVHAGRKRKRGESVDVLLRVALLHNHRTYSEISNSRDMIVTTS